MATGSELITGGLGLAAKAYDMFKGSTDSASSGSAYLMQNTSNGSLFPGGINGKNGKDDITVIDSEWVKSRCMVPGSELDPQDKVNRHFTTTYWKYTNSALGGNIGMNPKPQYTRYADIRSSSRAMKWNETTVETGKDLGMGRYYSEAIDDHAQLVHFEFGVPKFNSLLHFFTNAIDYRESVIANEGRSAIWYGVGKFAGAAGMLVAFPWTTLTIWLAQTVKDAISIFSPMIHRYYYLKPTMHTYWSAVNILVTNMATEIGILAPGDLLSGETAQRIGVPIQLNKEDMQGMAELFPGLIHPDSNYIDVLRIAARSQIMATKMLSTEQEEYIATKGEGNEPANYIGYVLDRYSKVQDDMNSGVTGAIASSTVSLTNYMSKLKEAASSWFEPKDIKSGVENAAKVKEEKEAGGGSDNTVASVTNEMAKKPGSDELTGEHRYGYRDDLGFMEGIGMLFADEDEANASKDYMSEFGNVLLAGAREGARFASFYVDYTGSVSDSFSSSTGPISSETGAKSIAQAGRNMNFMLGGGNILPGMHEVVGAAKDVVAGALDSMTFGLSNVLQTLFGGAYIDMPNKWEDSEVSLANVSYSMTLISPYNNPVSQMINIYIPLAMIMAGALPVGTGASSYTSPFLCSCFDRGVQNIRLGMITSLSIERGTSNLAWSRTRRPLAIKVSFTVTNLSNMLTVPMTHSLFDAFKVSLMDDSPMGEYISCLCGRSMLVSKYFTLQYKLKWSRFLMFKDQSVSSDYWALRAGDWLDTALFGSLSSANAKLLDQQSVTSSMLR